MRDGKKRGFYVRGLVLLRGLDPLWDQQTDLDHKVAEQVLFEGQVFLRNQIFLWTGPAPPEQPE